ncbi:4928_t:CDS:2, partial [Ambispora leptoticha]
SELPEASVNASTGTEPENFSDDDEFTNDNEDDGSFCGFSDDDDEVLTLEEALSYVTPPIYYASNASSSTNAGGDPPIEVALWESFFDDVNGFTFDSIDPKPKFEKPQFNNSYVNVRYEEGVRSAFEVNICQVLNKLMGPDYEFSRWQDGSPGIPDFNCHYTIQLILCIENKRGLVLREISGRTFSEFYESSSKAKMVIQQIYNYMCNRQLQYGVLSTYEDHWFLRRPPETPSKLFVSSTLSSQSESPTVLKAYAYIAKQARVSFPSPHPNVITVPDGEGSDATMQNTRITRSMVRKKEDSTQGSSSNDSANQPNQQNLGFADFEFKSLLGEGRSGKTLLCEFRGEKIALKTVDLYKASPDILKEMQKEVKIYKDLKDIQGKYIPKLVCYGYYEGGWCYVIGTTLVGTHLSNDKKITTQQKSKALKALNEIHKRGVLHNDIREENILLGSA